MLNLRQAFRTAYQFSLALGWYQLELQPGGLSLAVVDGGQRVERALLHGFSCQVQCVTARQVGAVSRQSIGLLSGNPPACCRC